MVLINGVKYACERCIRGHRVTTCTHTDQPLTMIKPKGRPASQCQHCREQRKLKNLHVQCTCGKKGKSPGMHLASCLCHKNSHCTCSNSQKNLLNSGNGNIHHLNASERAKKKSLISAANSELPNFPSSSTFTPSLSSNYIIEDVVVPFDVGNSTGSANANGLFDLFSSNGEIQNTNNSQDNSINHSISHTNSNSVNNSRTNLIDSNSNSSVSPVTSTNYQNGNGGNENLTNSDNNDDRKANSSTPNPSNFHIKTEDIDNSPNSISLRPSSSASINPHIKQKQQHQLKPDEEDHPSKLDLDFKNEFDQDYESHLTPTELDLVDRMFPLFPLVGSLSFDDDKTQPLSSIPLSTPYNNDSSNSLSTPVSVSNSFNTTNSINANPHMNIHHSSIGQKYGSSSSTGNTSPATNNIHQSTKITKPHQPKPTRPTAIVPSTSHSHSNSYNHTNSNSSSNVNIAGSNPPGNNASTNSTNSGSHYQPIRPKRPESVLSIASNSSSRSFDINNVNNNSGNGNNHLNNGTQNSSINYTSHTSIIAGPGSHLANMSQNPSSTFLNGNLPNASNSQAFPPSIPFPSYDSSGNNNNATASSTASSQFGGSGLNESNNNQNANNNGNTGFGISGGPLMGNNHDGHYHQHPFGRIGLGSTNSSTNNITRLDEENISIHENDSSFNIDSLSNNGFQNGSGIDSDFMDSENWFNDLTSVDNKIRRNTSLSTTSSFANIYSNSTSNNPFSEHSTIKRQSSLPRRSTTNGFTDLTISNSDTKLSHSIARANTTNSMSSAHAANTSTVASTTGASIGGSSSAAAYIDNSISITPPPNNSDNELSFPPFQQLPSQQSVKGGSISQSESSQRQQLQQHQQEQQPDYEFQAPMFSDLLSPIYDSNKAQYD
ncbi:copper resistance protein [Scheffersomyces coipomensis]|uniref:copper resistance protein n=1 Tax=Scheffersomyces coipomensis TaxID=1788519 RepID=UPI00315C6AB5